jgi:YVTN family beta-propeller protein
MTTSKRLVIFLLGMVGLVAAPLPVVAEVITSDRGGILVANRNAGNISVIDVATNKATTIPVPGGDLSALSQPMYFAFSPDNAVFYVGDRNNNQVVAYDAVTFIPVGSIKTSANPAQSGVFHMWGNTVQNQLWVVNDVDKSTTVIHMVTKQVLANVPVPADLVAAGGLPHDVILDPVNRFAYVTVWGVPGPDQVVKYSTDTFLEVGRAGIGETPHVAFSPLNNRLFLPSDASNRLDILNATTLGLVTSLSIPGAHGADISPDGKTFYTTNITGGGTMGIWAIDAETNVILGSLDTPFPTPHNIAIAFSDDGKLLYITHSGATAKEVSIYDISNRVPVLLGSVDTDLNPFGIASIPRVVPEPGAWLLLLAGGVPLVGIWWRRRK